MIRLEHISKSYDMQPRGSEASGRTAVLNDVSLEVARGRITAIVGPSGAGKSTLLHIMATLLKPDSGQVFYGDKAVTALPAAELARWRNGNIGLVFQNHRLLPEFTVQENVAMPALIGGMAQRKAMARAKELLEGVGLGRRLGHRPGQLSGGEAQRAAVCRALVNSPEVILADEPTGALDSVARDALQDLFEDICRSRGTTLVMVTHDESIARRAHSIVRLVDGRIATQ